MKTIVSYAMFFSAVSLFLITGNYVIDSKIL